MTDEAPRRVGCLVWAGAIIVTLLLSLVVVVATANAWNAAGPAKDIPVRVAVIVIEILLVTVVVWAALYYGIIRGRRAASAGRAFAVLLSASIIFYGAFAALIVVIGHRQAARRDAAFATDTNSDAQIALDEAVTSVDSLTRQREAVQLRTHANGVPGDIARGAKTMLHAVMAARTDSETAIGALGYPAFMVPEKLVAGDHIARARTALAQVRAALDRREQRSDAAIAAFRALVAASPIDARHKEEGLARLDAAIASERDLRAKRVGLERNILDESLGVVNELDRRDGWTILNNRVSFSKKTAYDRYVLLAKAIAADSADVRRQWRDAN